MKTKNNVQKAILRGAAVIVSLVLISYTVSAQEFWKRLLINSSLGDIALAMSATDESASSTKEPVYNKADFQLIAETEPAMDLESWMVDNSKFDVATIDLEVVPEPAMELEPWMTDQEFFVPVSETEPAMELESWMVSEVLWSK